jgi:hypothetical protein
VFSPVVRFGSIFKTPRFETESGGAFSLIFATAIASDQGKGIGVA